ncbi:high-affinity branched-chain amino acid transport system permease protein LivH [mine drainage metagenome]|uniref:High-affinity branched-chain amino acid transport system permease protein LivH n=1 Tax=mine drainage metagenome TaxID=410659 RepID=A0A1J5R1W1_9ZZZZ
MDWINTLVEGVLAGALYALFAAGLSLVFGVMRLVNLAHGDFIVLAAYFAYALVAALGLPPLLTLMLVVPLMAGLGYVLQRGLLNRTLGQGILSPLLVTFGLSIILQNGMMQVFSANTRRLHLGSLEVASLHVLPGLSVGWYPLLVLVVAVALIGLMQMLLFRTRLGAALRASSDDIETVRLMGVDSRHLFAVATGLAMAIAAVAGVLMAAKTNFDPMAGPSRLIYAFEAVIIGGMGSLWGTLIGGMVVGIAQAVGGAINPGWQILAGHLAFLAILVAAPRGLFPRTV